MAGDKFAQQELEALARDGKNRVLITAKQFYRKTSQFISQMMAAKEGNDFIVTSTSSSNAEIKTPGTEP